LKGDQSINDGPHLHPCKKKKKIGNRTIPQRLQSLATEFEIIRGIPFQNHTKYCFLSKCKPTNTAFLLLIELEILACHGEYFDLISNPHGALV